MDAENNNVKLKDVGFDLYREAMDGETGEFITKASVKELPVGNFVKVGSTQTTNEQGMASFGPLDLGDYYLVETKAPTGYTKWATAQKITVSTSGDNYNSSNGIYTQQVTNSTGFNLPQTGGAGTILFSVVGIALMAGAVVVFIVMKRKEPNK